MFDRKADFTINIRRSKRLAIFVDPDGTEFAEVHPKTDDATLPELYDIITNGLNNMLNDHENLEEVHVVLNSAD